MSTSAFVRHHPNLSKRLWGSIIPLGVHADAGAFNKHDSVYAVSFNSLLGTGKTTAKRFLFTALRKSTMRADSLDAVLRILSWSLNVLLSGTTPSEDWAGRQLRGSG
eukprot:6479338-Pyramimonas_sp.AAC.1